MATSFPVHPPRGGGQQRVFGLYSALARLGVDVDLVTLGSRFDSAGSKEIAPGLREIRIPRSFAHEAMDSELHARTRIPASDIGLTLFHKLTPAYGQALRESAERATVVVASHPFALPAIEMTSTRPLIYEAHNVELDLKNAMLGGAATPALDVVREVERDCCRRADLILVCSSDDRERLGELYGVPETDFAVVPNGVDADATSFTAPHDRRRHKELLGLEDEFLTVFVGSWHEPNLAAMRDVLAAAHELRDSRFLLIGSACQALDEDVPSNVDVCGVVEAGFLRAVLATADVALNPMRFGSGTNLKMLEYAAAGIPIISSPVGGRGLGFEPNRHYLACQPDELIEAIPRLKAEEPARTARRVDLARRRVVETFDWDVIARQLLEHPTMQRLLDSVPIPR